MKAITIWLTGLSGSGKSTLALHLQRVLLQLNYNCVVYDGDEMRKHLCADLGFSLKDRNENIRRVAEASKKINAQGVNVIVALISPFEKSREMARKIIGKDNFYEIYLDANLDVCEKRDVKGLYKKARKGLISDFTGISSPFEPPQFPAITIHTGIENEKKSLDILLNFFLSKIQRIKS